MPASLYLALMLAAAATSTYAAPVKGNSGADLQDSHIKYLFAFGDSYTASSFDIDGTQPSPVNPMGNPAFGTGTGPAQGINYVERLTATYNTSLTYTFNFAQSGATTSQKVSPVTALSFEDQVGSLFMPKYSSRPADVAPWNCENSIFSIFVGINDIGSNYQKPGVDRDSILNATMHSYWTSVQALYDSGARRFIFTNVPPLDRSPLISNPDRDPEVYAAWVAEYNKQLAANVRQFTAAHTDTKVAFYDFQRFFGKVLDNPAAFGFANAQCQGNGNNTCIWGDMYHPGYTLHRYWAKDMLTKFYKLQS